MKSADEQPQDGQKIVPLNSSEILPVEGYSKDNNPLERGNRLNKPTWALVLKRVWADFFYLGLLDRGATLTYFTLLAFAPTVLAAYSVATLLFASREEDVQRLTGDFIRDFVPDSLSEQATNLVASIVGSTAEGTWALVFSVLFSLFSASAYVRAFSRTSNMVYGRVEGRGLIRTWGMMWALTIFLVIGGVIVLFANLLRDTIISGVVRPIAEPLGLLDVVDYMLNIFLPVWDWLRLPVTIVVVLTLVAVLYHFAPNVKPLRFRWITLGSVISVTVCMLVWYLFGLYLQLFAGTSAYGAVSTIMALFMAVWIMNTVLVIGVKIDAEVLRAKELQRGMPSERYIQAPPRADTASQNMARTQQDLEERSTLVAQEHQEPEPDKS